MKKNEPIDLRTPQRQSIWAIIFIVLRFLRSFIRQAWVIFIPIFLGRGRSDSQWDTWELAIAGLGLFSAIWSIIAYFRYYYHLGDEELIIQKGLLNKANINIPYERIQSVNFNQNFLHQFLNVTEVAIDTAGSGDKEIQIDALTIDVAKALRQQILEKKKEEVSGSLDIVLEEDEEVIMTLSKRELIKVGLTQNHLKPISLILGFISSLWIYAWQFDIEVDPKELLQTANTFMEDRSIPELIFLIAIFSLISVAYSVITTYLNHADLRFIRKEKKFQLTQGLFTRKEIAAVDRKIQFVRWGQNLLQRSLGFFNLRFEQAGSRSLRERINNFRIPGCTVPKIDYVKKAWLKLPPQEYPMEKVSIHMFYYSLRYLLLIFGVLLALLAYNGAFKTFTIVLIVATLIGVIEWMQYKKKGFYFDNQVLYISGGGLGFKYALMPTYKIQNLSIEQSPYQWRRQLASLKIYTAAGALVIPFISEKRAKELLDFFIHHVEVSNKPWM